MQNHSYFLFKTLTCLLGIYMIASEAPRNKKQQDILDDSVRYHSKTHFKIKSEYRSKIDILFRLTKSNLLKNGIDITCNDIYPF